MKECITVAVAGFGLRGKTYSEFEKLSEGKMKVVAVADIVAEKVEEAAKEYNISKEMCFTSAEEMLKHPKLADVMFVTTQDRQHVAQAVKAIEQGYDVLVEKPISPDLEECLELQSKAHEYNKIVTVCHVLRYTKFFEIIKKCIDSGKLGEIRTIQAIENVGYYHQAHSFVRGNWRNSIETSPMILAKSCHDMDILQWLMGKRCEKISSFGSLSLFKEENAPEGSTDRCLEGCKCKESCPYDAEKIYISDKLTGIRHGAKWPCEALTLNPSEDRVYEALKTGPYGRCVYKCDNDVVDHQVVIMQFEDGSTADFTMTAFTEKCSRQIKVMGTMGEIIGDLENNIIKICYFGKEAEIINVNEVTASSTSKLGGHGGGDEGLIRNTVDVFLENNPENNLTSIDASVHSHVMALAAEYSRINKGTLVDLTDFIKKEQYKEL